MRGIKFIINVKKTLLCNYNVDVLDVLRSSAVIIKRFSWLKLVLNHIYTKG